MVPARNSARILCVVAVTATVAASASAPTGGRRSVNGPHIRGVSDASDVGATIGVQGVPIASGAPAASHMLGTPGAPTIPDFTAARQVLQSWVDKGAFPGAVAGVFRSSDGQALMLEAFGRLGDVGSSGTEVDSLYDLASLTKVAATTLAAMALYQQGLLSLETRVAEVLGAGFAQHGKGEITVEHLLTHTAGFPPDPVPGYSTSTSCNRTLSPTPSRSLECDSAIFTLLQQQHLANPVGSTFVYSDLSMITLFFAIGKIVQEHVTLPEGMCRSWTGATDAQLWACHFSSYVEFLFKSFHTAARYRPGIPTAPHSQHIAPTIRGRPAGVVEDDNAFALGGLSGHAGLFGSALDLAAILRHLVAAPVDDPLVNATTVETFTTVRNASLSSRALGWDTNPGLGLCGPMPETTFTHTGYTGTMVCALRASDQGHGFEPFFTVLLTNRVWPEDSAESKADILVARAQFHAAVVKALSGSPNGGPVPPYSFPRFRQCDDRWGQTKMGVEGPGERATICKEGCAMSSLAMGLAGLGVAVPTSDGRLVPADPGSLNDWLLRNKGYLCDAGDCNNLVLDAPNRLTPLLRFDAERPKPPLAELGRSAAEGRALFLAHVHHGGHFVLVIGTEGDAILVNDPFYNTTKYSYEEVSDVIVYNVTVSGAGASILV